MLPLSQIPTAVMRQHRAVYRELFRLYSVVDSLVPIGMIDSLFHCSSREGKLIFGQ